MRILSISNDYSAKQQCLVEIKFLGDDKLCKITWNWRGETTRERHTFFSRWKCQICFWVCSVCDNRNQSDSLRQLFNFTFIWFIRQALIHHFPLLVASNYSRLFLFCCFSIQRRNCDAMCEARRHNKRTTNAIENAGLECACSSTSNEKRFNDSFIVPSNCPVDFDDRTCPGVSTTFNINIVIAKRATVNTVSNGVTASAHRRHPNDIFEERRIDTNTMHDISNDADLIAADALALDGSTHSRHVSSSNLKFYFFISLAATEQCIRGSRASSLAFQMFQ